MLACGVFKGSASGELGVAVRVRSAWAAQPYSTQVQQ